MLLNAQNLTVGELASKDKGRLNIHGVYVCPLVTVATDGHCLGAVTTPDVNPDDYPTVDCGGIGTPTDYPPPAVIPSHAVTAALRNIPKKAAKRIPVLANVVVVGDNGSRRLVTTDLDATYPVDVRTVDGADFPDWQRVIPTEPPTLTIGFNADLMARVCATAAKMGAKGMRFSFTDDTHAVTITADLPETGQSALFLVMPMRI
jgi:hypothetical protein